MIQVEAIAIVNIVYHKHTMINNCDNTLPFSTALIRLEKYRPSVPLNIYLFKSFAMNRFQFDMMVKVKVNLYANLIDERAR